MRQGMEYRATVAAATVAATTVAATVADFMRYFSENKI